MKCAQKVTHGLLAVGVSYLNVPASGKVDLKISAHFHDKT